MTHKIVSALAAALVLSARGAAARPRDLPQGVPQMRLTVLAGEMRVEAASGTDIAADQELPYIRSGSVVRILLGRAEFETDDHAMIRAGKGDAFSFVAKAAKGSKPGSVRIAAVAENEEPSLNVTVGDTRLRIQQNGILTITDSGSGEAAVSAEGMPPGQPLVVRVSSDAGFAYEPVSLSSVAVDRSNDTAFELWTFHPGENPQVSKAKRAAAALAGWPKISQRAAGLLMNKYGLPDAISPRQLVWNDNGPWRKTIVFRTGTQHGFFQDPDDVIRQSIDYVVPRRKAEDLAAMDIGLTIDRYFAGLTATSDSEKANFLAINLAIEVIKNADTPEEARDSFTREITLVGEGKSSPYLERFLFAGP